MAIGDLKTQIARLPEQPGVYLYQNSHGDTIYVGKARSLRDRVRSYLGARGVHPKTDALLDEVSRLEVIVTDSVVEALALENNLIKQRNPKFNILLRDDKNYPYLQLTTAEAFPRVLVARRVERDGNVYAGPFLPASFARRTMALTHRLFGIRSCNEIIDGQRGRACLEYDINRCIAPCVEALCTRERYDEAVTHTRLFLEGRNDELLDELRGRMVAASEAERFEQAAQLRDAIRTIQTLRDRQQKLATAGLGDRDAFGIKLGSAGAVIQVFQMRGGRVIERVELTSDVGAVRPVADVARGAEMEVLQAAVQQFYQERLAPPEVHVPMTLDEGDAIEAWLTAAAGRRVRLVVPVRGEKRGLLELATRNAALAYDALFNDTTVAHYDALETLRDVLALPTLPRRIECFDISTIQGSETVASMVVCEEGRMRRGEYRKFRIRGQPPQATGFGLQASGAQSQHPGPDDFAAMREVIQRRYQRVLERGGPFPDLVLIDGGAGQLTAAYDALETLGLANLMAVGIAKKEEVLYTRERRDPIALPRDNPALLLVQRIRDEAHRFALTFHRQSRAKRDFRSELDSVAGIGPRRRKVLLTRFGSLAGVRRASREDLVPLIGARAADAVLEYFRQAGK